MKEKEKFNVSFLISEQFIFRISYTLPTIPAIFAFNEISLFRNGMYGVGIKLYALYR